MLRARAVVFWVLVVLSLPAAAEPLKTVVRLTSDADKKLYGRIRGQTSDIGVKLFTARTGPLEQSLEAQLEAADRLAATRGATSVVWFDAKRGAVVVHVAESPEGKLFIRTVEPGRGRSSAMLEAAAMMVRTALRAQVQGEPLGEDRKVVLAGFRGPVLARPPSLRPKPERRRGPRPPFPVDPEEEVPIQRGVPDRWLVGIGWQAGIDGHTTWGLHGPVLSVQRVVFGHGYLGITAAPGVPGRFEDELAAIYLSRHLFGVTGGARIELGRGFDVALGLQLGVALFRRSTEPARAGVIATEPSWTPSLLLAPEVGIGWTWKRTVRLSVCGGVDYVPGAPVLAYGGEADADLPTHDLWRVQPRVSLGLQLVLQ
jgi:hypothetical protein